MRILYGRPDGPQFRVLVELVDAEVWINPGAVFPVVARDALAAALSGAGGHPVTLTF